MDQIYFSFGFFILAIFILKPGLLIKEFSFKVILVISIVGFVVGLTLHFTEKAHSWAGALLAPLPILGFFRLCLRAFLKVVHREPVDVAYNWSSGLFKDRVFSFVFFFGGVFILMVAMLGMEKLARLRW